MTKNLKTNRLEMLLFSFSMMISLLPAASLAAIDPDASIDEQIDEYAPIRGDFFEEDLLAAPLVYIHIVESEEEYGFWTEFFDVEDLKADDRPDYEMVASKSKSKKSYKIKRSGGRGCVAAQSGMASWYGEDFHGKKTAYNDERFDRHGFTAAHKTLAFGSVVRVSHGKKSVNVRINDNGPFHGGRVIDLSEAAARKLGILKAGTARVQISLISCGKRKS